MIQALFNIDWQEVFLPKLAITEIILRGSLIYIVLFLLLRLLQKRQSGAIGVTDLLVLVLLADAAQNAMAGGYQSVTEGIVLVATIVFWDYTLNWLGYQFPQVQRFVYPPPLPLVRNGRLLRHNLERELITLDELKANCVRKASSAWMKSRQPTWKAMATSA